MLIPGDLAADGLLPGGGQPGGRVERQVVANRVFKVADPPQPRRTLTRPMSAARDEHIHGRAAGRADDQRVDIQLADKVADICRQRHHVRCPAEVGNARRRCMSSL